MLDAHGVSLDGYGLNVLEEKKKKSIVIRFGKQLVNFFALLLWTGSLRFHQNSFFIKAISSSLECVYAR